MESAAAEREDERAPRKKYRCIKIYGTVVVDDGPPMVRHLSFWCTGDDLSIVSDTNTDWPPELYMYDESRTPIEVIATLRDHLVAQELTVAEPFRPRPRRSNARRKAAHGVVHKRSNSVGEHGDRERVP